MTVSAEELKKELERHGFYMKEVKPDLLEAAKAVYERHMAGGQNSDHMNEYVGNGCLYDDLCLAIAAEQSWRERIKIGDYCPHCSKALQEYDKLANAEVEFREAVKELVDKVEGFQVHGAAKNGTHATLMFKALARLREVGL